MANDIITQQELNLRPNHFFTLTDELIFFMAQNLSRIPSRDLDKLERLRDELIASKNLIVSEKSTNNKGETLYVFMTANFIFKARASTTEGKLSFNIDRNLVEEGRDFIASKKNRYYEKGVFYIETNFLVCVILGEKRASLSNLKSVPTNWGMPEDLMSSLISAIDEYQPGSTSYSDLKKVSSVFDKQILTPIKDYTYYEDQAEQLGVYGESSLTYDRFDQVNSTARKKVYTFISSTLDPDSELYTPGDAVAIETNIEIGENQHKQIKGVVIDRSLVDDGVAVKVEIKDQFDHSVLVTEKGKIIPLVNDTQKRVREDVIKKIRTGKVTSTYMYDFFTTYRTKGYAPQPGWNEFYQELKAKKYPPNESQMEAIKKGIETKDIQLVLGPPGTGKTTVIVSWLEYFMRRNMKILVSSQNNSAVDNVLERVGRNPKAKLIRVGNLEKIQENCKQYALENKVVDTIKQYNSKLDSNLALINEDIGNIAHILEVTKEQMPAYKDIQEKLEERFTFRRNIGEIPNVMFSLKTEAEEKLCEIKSSTQRIKKHRAYLASLENKNIFIKFFIFPKIFFSKKALKLLLSKRIKLANKYNESVKKYNVYSFHLQQELNSDKYVSWKQIILDIKEKIEKVDIFTNLKGPFKNNEISYEQLIWSDLTPATALENYRYKLLSIQNDLTNAALALSSWKESISSKNSDVVSSLLIKSANVVGATCIGINSQRKFANIDFDVTIIDESGQIQIHNAIVPMSRSPKTLMLGDHLQIPPMANDEVVRMCKAEGIKTDLLEMSFFEYLFKKLEDKSKDRNGNKRNCPNITRLNEQFRMPGNISDVIADWFYEGNYHAHYDMSKWQTVVPNINSPLVIISTSKAKNRQEQGPGQSKDQSPGYCNELEADIVADIVVKVFKQNPEMTSEDIGVISAYGKQVRLIRQKLKTKLKKANIKMSQGDIFSIAASLDSFQGQERPLIIYSSTRSSSRPANKARVGFMKELRRLNVAFTRCQKQLIIIGDFDYLTSCEYEELDPETGTPVPNKSEKKYAQFMQKMVDQALSDKGEFYMLQDFYEKVEL